METGKMGKDAADSIQVAAAGKICENRAFGPDGKGSARPDKRYMEKLMGPPFMGIIEKKDFDNKDEDFYSSDVRSCE